MIISKTFWEKEFNIPAPSKEYRFCKRKYRIDFAWPEVKLAVEIEGGVWITGRHNRASGFIKDIEKYNLLSEHGWTLLRYLPNEIDYIQIQTTYNALYGI